MDTHENPRLTPGEAARLAKSPRGIRIVSVAAALALAGVAVWLLRGPAPTPAGPGAGPGGAPGGIPVEIARAEAAPLAENVRAVGTLRSDESVIIRPELPGRVVETPFAEGQMVARGALLFRIEDNTLKAELGEAEAAHVLSRQNNVRARELMEKGAGTARARDEAFAKMEMDKARVELARARIATTRIQAPFAGIVGLRKVSVGDYVQPGQDLVNLESIDTVKLDFRIPERYLGVLAVGQKVRADMDAFPGRAFEGQVFAIDPQIDAAGHSIAVRATLSNPDRVLRPGLFARVALTVREQAAAVAIPEQAIMPRGDKFFVYRVVGGKAALTPVEIGRRAGGRVEIARGLKPGEEVVVAGQIKLQDGSPVEAAAPPKPGS
ncbi:MAG: efflux RND transporter periplasmic adaptor subunit [Rhodospirillales bacterium]|nr:efflux RND transporter periplasmic adaptor subunit [Rhodospirillales bacterium]MSP79961.1 efflux RND transporter periplasmic adaptor subunit [Rhodospirillales bacterium]